ncbi:DMT family transporter [Citreicella sp. C3M06]|uniref:DMT family transporter n=1 Tax=Citreicella sp. C3M06 TaxID=2841564 RepID=UPI0020915E14|nr:DMT family transporter [Citreicella sp. C3M06]
MRIPLIERFWSAAPLLLSLASLFWAGNFVVGRAFGGEGTLSPVALAFWRWAAAFVLVLLLGGARAWRERAAIARSLPLLTAYALLSVTLYNTLVYAGLKSTTTINALLLQSTMPVMILVCGAAIYRDRIDLSRAGGVVLSLAGVLLILSEGDTAGLGALELGRGGGLVLAGVAANAIYFSTLRSRPDLHPMTFLVAIFGLGTFLLLPFWIQSGAAVPQGAVQLAGIGYLALCASLLALLFFNRGIALIGAGRAGVFLHLMPVFGSLLSMLVLDEQLRLFHAFGFALVLSGVLLATRSAKKSSSTAT